MANTCISKNESGSVAVLFAVGVFVLLGVIGLTLINSDVNWTRTQSQVALDAAVLAAASAPYGTTDDERIVIAKQFYAADQRIRQNTGTTLSVTAKEPAAFTIADTVVRGEALVDRRSPFLGLFGADKLTVRVKSQANKQFGAPVCVLGLDPTEDATMDFNGWASLQVENCATQANSASGVGLHQVGQPSMKAKEIGVTGGYEGTSYYPLPITGTRPIQDPLASLPEPPTGVCHPRSGSFIQQEVATLTPGTYCGGLSIKAQSVITLMPGIYIFKDGPLTLNSGAIVTGNEVMLAFLGESSTLNMYGDTSMTVTSPTSGTYRNIQFFGDRNTHYVPGGNGANGNNLWFTVIGGSNLTFNGVLYAPTFHVWLAGNSYVEGQSTNYLAIAKKLWFQDKTRVHLVQKDGRGMTVDATAPLQYGSRLTQ